MSKKNKAIIIVTILLAICILAIVVFITTSKQKQNIILDNKDINTVNEINEEFDLQEKNKNIIDDEIESIDNESVIVEENQVTEEPSESVTNQPIQENMEQKKNSTTSSSSSSKSISQTITSNPSESTVVSQPQTNIVQEQEILQSVETQSQTTEPTKEENVYWCADGGTHHIYGDGENEHGYYKTWDEAFKAYEEYTKDWESTQFKVDQCACGLYYFWAIK